MDKSINFFTRIIYLSLFISLFFYILSSLYQPLIGDDYTFKHEILKRNNFFDHFIYMYMQSSGRFLQNVLSYYVFTSEIFLYILKFFSIPVFILSIWLGWYCLNNEFINLKSKNFWKFICFLGLVWISTPSISENVIWTTGFITWTYPLFFSMIYLSLIFHFYYSVNNKLHKVNYKLSLNTILYIIIGFISGSCIQQLSCINFTITFLLLLKIKTEKRNVKIPINIYLGFSFLIIGIFFLIFSPGNYLRYDLIEDSFFQKSYKYILYLFSAYYELGSENAGKIFFLSLISLTFILNPELNFFKDRFKFSIIWFIGSLFSLIVMFPVSTFLSVRTTFFAVIFFYFFWLGLNYNKYENIFLKEKLKKIIILFVISSLLFFDSFVGFITNKSLFEENQYRYELIENAKLNKVKEVTVPYFSTIPSRLTFMHNPYYDRKFLHYISNYMNINVSHDIGTNSQLPNTKNILKEVKNYFNN